MKKLLLHKSPLARKLGECIVKSIVATLMAVSQLPQRDRDRADAALIVTEIDFMTDSIKREYLKQLEGNPMQAELLRQIISDIWKSKNKGQIPRCYASVQAPNSTRALTEMIKTKQSIENLSED